MEAWRLFWAKTNREKIEGLSEDWTHPLWAHLIDVGSAAQVLWDQFLPASLKQNMAEGIGMNLTDAGKFLSVWIGLHDLGKAIPSFQGIPGAAPRVVAELAKAGLVIDPNANRLHHGHASIAIALRWLHSDLDTQRPESPKSYLLDALAACVGIHHGKLAKQICWVNVARDINRSQAVLGNAQWRQAQQDLANAVFAAWGTEWPADRHRRAANPRLGKGWPDWLMAFAGWATLADWLGSMQGCFSTATQPSDDLRAYLDSSHIGAKKAFVLAGLDQQARLRQLTFQEYFKNDPRPLQEIARDISLHPTEPNLLIMEAPTGEGKTEAAFYLAARFRGGIYAAMPSQATSNGIFPRLCTFVGGDTERGLAAAHDGPIAALRLVHGNDLLREDALTLLKIDERPPAIDDDDEIRKSTSGAAGRMLSWFMPKKRALLVPYGVGTVDQLFLGVLYAKHFFLRLFSLCGKTVIFDEVHAYDTYMNTIFERLLAWLRALNVNVVVLSATLPAETRQRMLTAWGGNLLADKASAPYPIAWHVAGGHVTAHDFLPDPNRKQQLRFDWCDPNTGVLAKKICDLLANGATVIVICNKVERAQDLFALLDKDELLHADDRILLHARMPQAWRQIREDAALTRFGKDRPNRPGLLVGTQVIEQSLDLDADAMITDLAPVDLLLQRAGRLHRHNRDDQRPTDFKKPMLLIACPEADSGELPNVDELSGGGKIYARKLLWQTYNVMKRYGGWALPCGHEQLPGYRQLIDDVYTTTFSFDPPLSTECQRHYDEADRALTDKEDDQEKEARQRLVPKPNALQELFTSDDPELAEEDETSNGKLPKHLQAFTRNPDGLNAEVLLLHRTVDGWSQHPNGETLIWRGKITYLTPERLQAVFGSAVRISHAGIVSTLFKEPNPEWQWQQDQSRILKRFHLIELTNYAATIGTTRLILDDRLGVCYPKQM
ncbi:CRISPR-associated helicase Cas3' [Fibrella sp. HMF5335]|uniref:CRISPR-associated helicase Cas3 n=1 Tax=Fibrella rubiginis TaxID=2817060 RepID=A0A939GL17_9BACT|nr:CRISPR-associated helicase Cas3' [Fibrella rubiginis]MBO0938691.1 CRISPR-associated helicase Cas3' [Fibrella rubiginis]